MNRSHILSILFIFLVTCLIFFKIFTKGLYPIPGDLLVSFYFPWYSGGWEGYNPWTTHKELLAADSVRQIYPWKEFAANQFKNGQFPLWNPYTFSGQPLAANFQSSVYYPLNLLYFLIDAKNAWLLLIVFQPFLGGIFTYFATRSFKVSHIASVFAAVAFMFSSYMVTWMENGNIGHSYIWLPLSFWAINNYFEKFKFRYLFVLTFSMALSILGGHPQTAIYLYLATVIFWIFKLLHYPKMRHSQKLAKVVILIFTAVASFLVSAIQLFPTIQFYRESPISLPFSKEVFEKSIIPPKNFITFFASDFFGHPANNNYWNHNYGDFTPYFGVVPLVFAIWCAITLWSKKFVKFATLTSLFFILAAINGPITYLIKTLRIPVIDSTTPARFISISIFLLIILAAFGFEDFIKNLKNSNYQKKFLKFLISISLVYLAFWIFAIFGQLFLEPKDIWQTNLAVTRRNLILPTGMFLLVPVLLVSINVFKKLNLKIIAPKYLLMLGVFVITLVGGIYYSNKFLPVAPKIFIFPDHPLFDWIKNNAGIYRFYGGGTAHIDFNFPTHYQIYGAEGYDTLRYERYAQLLASSFTGEVPKSYLRSDGVFPNEENGYRRRLFELLGVKYLLDKVDEPKTAADWHYERFSGDKVSGIWQKGKFQVYQRQPVLPRVFLTTKYYLSQNDQEIIEKIYDPNFNLETIILEEEPALNIADVARDITIPRVETYEPNKVVLKTNLDYNSLLFFSDNYDPDWQVYIDGQKSKLLRTHYALRAVAVPGGNHQVVMRYQPQSFALGLKISLLTLFGLTGFAIYLIVKRKF